ncbi:DNA-directed RNA polymerase subunit K [Candidatus Nanohalobium constans]|uniref:DNA-directed RNA polymerase subunit K n=1 Tax=Candidatus Nanohalobium constans TaxID=2565781 RepID=A0A5Q0UF58_9ARCH|nr:DNA-directed RNA polymerase subunit K [Candidatus Nanohalobium constans]QGA80186.1 DNA-directed RNA polymerase subunit K [Candidatus Nanohalobium constans]
MTEYTRYERARILGARSLQLSMGAPAFVDAESNEEPKKIAEREMEAGKLPLTVKK